jgi:hypothetical protein
VPIRNNFRILKAKAKNHTRFEKNLKMTYQGLGQKLTNDLSRTRKKAYP